MAETTAVERFQKLGEFYAIPRNMTAQDMGRLQAHLGIEEIPPYVRWMPALTSEYRRVTMAEYLSYIDPGPKAAEIIRRNHG